MYYKEVNIDSLNKKRQLFYNYAVINIMTFSIIARSIIEEFSNGIVGILIHNDSTIKFKGAQLVEIDNTLRYIDTTDPMIINYQNKFNILDIYNDLLNVPDIFDERSQEILVIYSNNIEISYHKSTLYRKIKIFIKDISKIFWIRMQSDNIFDVSRESRLSEHYLCETIDDILLFTQDYLKGKIEL